MSSHSKLYLERQQEIKEKEKKAKAQLESAAEETERQALKFLKSAGIVLLATGLAVTINKYLFKSKVKTGKKKKSKPSAKAQSPSRINSAIELILERLIAGILPIVLKGAVKLFNNEEKNSVDEKD